MKSQPVFLVMPHLKGKKCDNVSYLRRINERSDRKAFFFSDRVSDFPIDLAELFVCCGTRGFSPCVTDVLITF